MFGLKKREESGSVKEREWRRNVRRGMMKLNRIVWFNIQFHRERNYNYYYYIYTIYESKLISKALTNFILLIGVQVIMMLLRFSLI